MLKGGKKQNSCLGVAVDVQAGRQARGRQEDRQECRQGDRQGQVDPTLVILLLLREVCPVSGCPLHT